MTPCGLAKVWQSSSLDTVYERRKGLWKGHLYFSGQTFEILSSLCTFLKAEICLPLVQIYDGVWVKEPKHSWQDIVSNL